MSRDYFFRRICSIVLCFFVFGAELEAKTPRVYTVRLPEKACQVKERWPGTSDKTIIHIQDAHSSIEAQKNLSEIIQYLVSENEVKLVGVEGASSEIEVDGLKKFKDRGAKEIVSELLLESGILSGAEKSLITSKDDFRLVGMEDPEIFRKNFRAFFGTQLKKENILDQINQIEDVLNDLKTPIYNDALKLFDQSVQDWRSEKMEFTDFLLELNHHVIENEIELLDYVHFSAFYEALKIRSRVPEVTLKSEFQTLEDMIQNLTETSENPSFKEIGAKFKEVRDSFKNETRSEKDYVEFLKHFSKKLDIDFETFLNLKEHLRYLQAFNRLDMAKVLFEVNQLTQFILQTLAKNPEEQMLVERVNHIERLKNLTSLAVVDDDVQYFNVHLSQFTFEYFYTFAKEKSEKHNISHQLNPEDQGINKILNYVKHFYKGAEIRNHVLVDNTLEEMNATGQRISILVAGGFHSKGITEDLRSKGVSYMVVTPRISSVVGDDFYAEKMRGNLFALSPQLVSHITLLGLSKFAAKANALGDSILNLAKIVGLTREVLEKYVEEGDDSASVYQLARQHFESLAASVSPDFSLDKGKARILELMADLIDIPSHDPIYILTDPQTRSDLGKDFKILDTLRELNPEGVQFAKSFSEDNRSRTVLITTNLMNHQGIDFTEEGPVAFVLNPTDAKERAFLYTIGLALIKFANTDQKQRDGLMTELKLLERENRSNWVFQGLASETKITPAVREAKALQIARQAA